MSFAAGIVVQYGHPRVRRPAAKDGGGGTARDRGSSAWPGDFAAWSAVHFLYRLLDFWLGGTADAQASRSQPRFEPNGLSEQPWSGGEELAQDVEDVSAVPGGWPPSGRSPRISRRWSPPGCLQPRQTFRRVLDLLACGEPLPLAWVEALVDPQAVDAAEADGHVVVEPDGVRTHTRLAHPLYGEVLRAAMPVSRPRPGELRVSVAQQEP